MLSILVNQGMYIVAKEFGLKSLEVRWRILYAFCLRPANLSVQFGFGLVGFLVIKDSLM